MIQVKKIHHLFSRTRTLCMLAFVFMILPASTSTLLSCAGKTSQPVSGAQPSPVEEKVTIPEPVKNETILHISGAISKLQEIKTTPKQKKVVLLTTQKEATSANKKQHISGTSSSASDKSRDIATPANALEHKGKEASTSKTIYLTSKKIAGSDEDLPPLRPEIASRFLKLNFNQADVIEIVGIIAELLEFDYIVEPGVGGKITIHTTEKISAKDLFSVLKQILSTNNLTIIKEGKYYKITQMAETQRKPLRTFVGATNRMARLDDTMIIQIVPLKYLPSDLLSKVLAPLLTKGGSFLALPSLDLLGIVDTSANLNRLLKLIKIMDINSFEKMNVKLFPITFGKASDLSKELETIFSTLGIAQKEQYFKFLPIPRLNSILTVSANLQYIKIVSDWIKKLDIPEVEEGALGTYFYTVQNGEAGNIASIIQTLFKGSSQKKDKNDKRHKKNEKKNPKKTPAGAKKSVSLQRTVEISGTTKIEGELDIVSDSTTNSIIIRTNAKNYPIILETMKQLDKMPLQVMIEIMVADLTLDNSTRFGIEWAVRHNSKAAGFETEHFGDGIGDTPLVNSSGASYFIKNTGSLLGFIQTKASESKLNVLSSPVILTSENKSASISITNDVPIEQRTVDSNGLTTTSYEYKSAGIKLTVTPRINSEKYVSMDINQEVSTVGEKPAGASEAAPPPFFTRQAQTSVVVKDQETLVIGGLIDNTKSSSQSGIPYLSKIPIIGRLFGNSSESKRKTELIILITPRVIETVKDGKNLTKAFRDRIDFLQDGIDIKDSGNNKG